MNSADEDLTFRVKAAPARGHLESTDFPGLPITTFTQLELAGEYRGAARLNPLITLAFTPTASAAAGTICTGAVVKQNTVKSDM